LNGQSPSAIFIEFRIEFERECPEPEKQRIPFYRKMLPFKGSCPTKNVEVEKRSGGLRGYSVKQC